MLDSIILNISTKSKHQKSFKGNTHNSKMKLIKTLIAQCQKSKKKKEGRYKADIQEAKRAYPFSLVSPKLKSQIGQNQLESQSPQNPIPCIRNPSYRIQISPKQRKEKLNPKEQSPTEEIKSQIYMKSKNERSSNSKPKNSK